MTIKELIHVVPPPDRVIDKGTKSGFKKSERNFGLKFPTDFLEFSVTYGTGDFCGGYIEIYNPCWDRYQEKIKYSLAQLEQETIAIPFNFHPTIPGLFPVGHDESNGNIYWYTEGEPDRWPIILSNRDRQFQRWDMTFTKFLAKAFANEIKTLIWEQFADNERIFRSRSIKQ